MLRSRTIQAGQPAQIITDVNRLLCLDTAKTGNFMSLFYLIIDTACKELSWVRAGHEPGILYDPTGDAFFELDGAGIALGVDETYRFESYSRTGLDTGQIVLIGTDGIWETENGNGERFGKVRLREIMCHNRHEPAEKVVSAVTKALLGFRGNAPQTDDITLVVVKAQSDKRG